MEVFGVRCCQVLLLILKAGLSAFETDSMLISAEVVWDGSNRHKRQSAALFSSPEIHSNVML